MLVSVLAGALPGREQQLGTLGSIPSVFIYEAVLSHQGAVRVAWGRSGLGAARCYQPTGGGRSRFAHTAPFHIDVAGRPNRVGIEYLAQRSKRRSNVIKTCCPLALWGNTKRLLRRIAELPRTWISSGYEAVGLRRRRRQCPGRHPRHTAPASASDQHRDRLVNRFPATRNRRDLRRRACATARMSCDWSCGAGAWPSAPPRRLPGQGRFP